MTRPTTISPDKLRAYRATQYCISAGDDAIVLRIGEHSPPAAALFAAQGVPCGAFITAYNPRGTLQPEAANAAAHVRLLKRLFGLGITTIEGAGGEPGSDWTPERSVMALGLDLDASRAVGCEFDQDAIVWLGADAIPQLVLLR
jgi:hypothetical protein